MKFIIGILLCVLFSCQMKEQSEKLENRNSKSIEKVVEYYESGVKKIEGELLDGERHGKWTAYYENGMKWSEGKYNKGLRYGEAIVYYENGKKKLEGRYNNNEKVGIWKVWEEDGSFVQSVNLDKPISEKDSLTVNTP